MVEKKGGFTLPGESGYEELTIRMAEKWGADVIRDSDGTELSPEILEAGYGIYSTICIIRDHNEWAKKHTDKLQQTFLMTEPSIATEEQLKIPLMKGFFTEQFQINSSEESKKYWEVYDRTTDTRINNALWHYVPEEEMVVIEDCTRYHSYTVSFLAYRIWEEISMYNHTTNHWDKEHLLQIDPIYEETQEYMLEWLECWCKEHPHTTVVRFTSLFYNFVWIWGNDARNRHLFTDWGSYDFTVSPKALDSFAQKYGYTLAAEDFVNQGKYQVTHMPATKRKRDWMEFVGSFVVDFSRKLIDITHKYDKKAYVFYDDSWVGMEPYGKQFEKFHFDGLIKCVFSGYEVRMCAGVPIATHELRLHPYLFPVGLGGAPTFAKGGDPTTDAKKYWISARRALLRAKIERIGLGGYLHLTEDFPEFQDYIEEITNEFRQIQDYHTSGKPYVFPAKVAVLHYWGKLRSWTLSGHFHETYMHDLIHVNEALSGLPLDVDFISFEDVKAGVLSQYDVVINAGRAESAWSGGDAWKEEGIVQTLNQWVYEGGTLIGIDEPSATQGYNYYFRMADVLGIDKDTGAKVCHGKWAFEVEDAPETLPIGFAIQGKDNLYLTTGKTKVLAAHEETPLLTVNEYGKGVGVYLSHFEYTPVNARMLLNLILLNVKDKTQYLPDNPNVECAYYPAANKLVVINNTDSQQECTVEANGKSIHAKIDAYGQQQFEV